MKIALPFTILALSIAACTAPQGKKYSATNRELPPIAMPPPEGRVELFESQRGSTVSLKQDGTLTVWLSSKPHTGYGWRLAEIPDPTVLRLVSKEFVPPSETNVGQEKWVFQAVGDGEIDLRLWYTSGRVERFGSAPVFKCFVGVVGDLVPMAKGPDGKNFTPLRKPHFRSHRRPELRPKVPRTTPAPETLELLEEPVFRSSRVLLRHEQDGRRKQG